MLKDLLNKEFGALKVIQKLESRITKSNKRRMYWLCLCNCGNTIELSTTDLTCGDYNSCGCRRGKYKHGHAKKKNITSEYTSWQHMLRRCDNPNDTFYSNYGGRGIKVCDEWKNSFETFLKDMGPKPNQYYTIDRIDSNGDYCPNNTRWVSRKEQQRNLRRNRYLTINGITKLLIDWSREYNIHYATLTHRANLGWTDNDLLKKPRGSK